MSANFPNTLRTIAFLFANPLSSAHLETFISSPELKSVLGKSIDEDLGQGTIDELADVLAEEYTRLFIGPYSHFPPLEGLARGDTQFLGNHAMVVRRAYTEAGFEPREETGLLPDHLGIELDFLATLLEGENIEEAQRFLQDHLLAWVPSWVDVFSSSARFRFYPAVGKALRDCLENIAALITNASSSA